jgi:hypothetical protein
MFKRKTPSSSKSTSPVPSEFYNEAENIETMETEESHPRHHEVNVDVQVTENDDMEPHHAALSGDTTENPSIHYQFTLKHPLGQILLNLFEENIKLAGKCNLKDMAMSVDELCRHFYNAQLMEKQKMKTNISQATSKIENTLITRELNSHIINQSVAPPQHFSPIATLLTPRQRADCMKLLPTGSSRFNGSEKGTSILEYLHQLNTIQKNCHLSLPEFYEIMLASTTGQAYLLIHSWIEGGETPETIYHNLLLHFDKRLQPEEARMRLLNYKAPKNTDLAKVEALIQSLASRISSCIPAGPSRTENYNMEVIQGLIRSLPLASKIIVQNTYNEKSASMRRALTASELSQFLNIYRPTIDSDIKLNGIDPREGVARRQPFRVGNVGARKNAVYHVGVTNGAAPLRQRTRTQQQPTPSPMYGQVSQVTQFRKNIPGGNRTYGYNNNNNNSNSSMRKAWDDKYGTRNSRVQNKSGMQNNRRPGNPQRRPFNNNRNTQNHYCSLCGLKTHLAISGCPNMRSDSGAPVSILPCKDTCNACPPFVNPRLSHPAYLCPYRKAGPWGGKQ